MRRWNNGRPISSVYNCLRLRSFVPDIPSDALFAPWISNHSSTSPFDLLFTLCPVTSTSRAHSPSTSVLMTLHVYAQFASISVGRTSTGGALSRASGSKAKCVRIDCQWSVGGPSVRVVTAGNGRVRFVVGVGLTLRGFKWTVGGGGAVEWTKIVGQPPTSCFQACSIECSIKADAQNARLIDREHRKNVVSFKRKSSTSI